jgi:H+/Cl- antiporter ClcA
MPVMAGDPASHSLDAHTPTHLHTHTHTRQSLYPRGNNHLIQFSVFYTNEFSRWEVLPFLVLAVGGGMMGSLFNLIITGTHRLKQRVNPFLGVAAAALVTALLSYHYDFLALGNTELIALLFSVCPAGVGGEGEEAPSCPLSFRKSALVCGWVFVFVWMCVAGRLGIAIAGRSRVGH